MPQIQSVYIVEPINQGWIIEWLMRDIASELNQRGIRTRIGCSTEYQGEDVIFNSRYLTALSDPRAKVNALFITHIDDSTKEMQLKTSFKNFNSFVCMSPQDADFVAALKTNRFGVVGIDLPARDLKVRPIRLAMFSACYEDGRKNEQWIVEHFYKKTNTYRQSFVFCFMGWGWEDFCAKLSKLDMNYEIYRYSRFTPGEYELYKEILAGTDALIYLGFDGGAMSVYDAINAGINVIVPNSSYHRGLGEAVTLFDDKSGFCTQLDSLQRRQAERREALQRRSVAAYSMQLVAHWNSLAFGDTSSVIPVEDVNKQHNEIGALAQFRQHYKTLTLSRLRTAVIRMVQARLQR